jgi:hypothetical protein
LFCLSVNRLCCHLDQISVTKLHSEGFLWQASARLTYIPKMVSEQVRSGQGTYKNSDETKNRVVPCTGASIARASKRSHTGGQ